MPTLFEGLTGPTEKVKDEIDSCYGVCESWLGSRRYIAADHLTIADLAVGATTNAMQTIHKIDATK